MRTEEAVNELLAAADQEKAKILTRFFKCGKGGYGEGDRFLGVVVPVIRGIVKRCDCEGLHEIDNLLESPWHEIRMLGVLLLEKTYRLDRKNREEIVAFYIRSLPKLNNWDLIDLSCYKILGDRLLDRPRGILYELARSSNLWEQRAAIVSTMALIKMRGETEDTLRIAEMLLAHRHDLIHKACGWLLRECAKRDKAGVVEFLERHYAAMPRTMLRYAIEKFPEEERKAWLVRK